METEMTPSPSRIDVEAIKAREQKATAGPWCYESVNEQANEWVVGVAFDENEHEVSGRIEGVSETIIGDCKIAECDDGADAEFIAHAREDVPALLAELARLQSTLKEVTESSERYAMEAYELTGRLMKAESTLAQQQEQPLLQLPDTTKADNVMAEAKLLLPGLRKLARDNGYALAVHGSLTRDIDLLAVPWTEKAIDALAFAELVRAEAERLSGHTGYVLNDESAAPRDYTRRSPEPKAHGRLGWSIHLAGTGTYIDLSVLPAGAAHESVALAESKRMLDKSYNETLKQSKRAQEAEASLSALQEQIKGLEATWRERASRAWDAGRCAEGDVRDSCAAELAALTPSSAVVEVQAASGNSSAHTERLRALAREWQPIETAPKDGTPVLLWEPGSPVKHDGIFISGEYVDFEKCGGAPEGYTSGWYDNVQGRYEIHPTHWMIPDPPVLVRAVPVSSTPRTEP